MKINSGSKRKIGVKIGDTESCFPVEPYNNIIHDKRGKHRKQAISHCSVILLIQKVNCIDTNKNMFSI